ncbi:MAG: alpha/beta fold hydrolase, partial [Acidobacteriota bacterium]
PLLAGHSMGGAVALQAALDHPTLSSALLLVSSGATLRVAQMVIETVRDHFDALPQLMGEMAFSRETPRPLVEESLATLFGAPRDVVLTDLQACNGWSVEPRLADLNIPVTALVGKDDLLTPPSLARRLKDRLPAAQVTVLEGVGHMAPSEATEAIANRLAKATGGRGG